MIDNTYYCERIIDLDKLKDEIEINEGRINKLVNVGNFFINKNEILNVISEHLEFNPYGSDSFFINYIWLKNKKYINVKKNMLYIHRLGKDSTWKSLSNESEVIYTKLKNEILNNDNH
jgi:hypothetical protein